MLGGFSAVSPSRAKQRDHTEIAFIKQKQNKQMRVLRLLCCPVQLLESRLQAKGWRGREGEREGGRERERVEGGLS